MKGSTASGAALAGSRNCNLKGKRVVTLVNTSAPISERISGSSGWPGDVVVVKGDRFLS